MRFRYAVLLLSIACSTPGPVYERGAFTTPPPAPTRPGIGLPQPHMPGQHVGPKVEPNPRPKRHLPPTPGGGPGIWGAEEPRAAADDHPKIDGFPLLYPPDASPEERRLVNACAGFMDAAMTRADRGTVRRAKMTLEARYCMMARLYEQCPTIMLPVWEKQRAEANRYDPDGQRAMEKIRDFAKTVREELCKDLLPFSPGAETLFDDVVREFTRTRRTHNDPPRNLH